MIVKSLVTGIAAVALVGAAAAGTNVASQPASSTAGTPQAIVPVVRQVPLPQAPAPGLQSALVSTLNGLTSAGSFGGAKGSYIQGGVGRLEAITADRAYSNAVREGVFPMSFAVADIDDAGDGTATANVMATAATGATASQPLTFVAGPSPSGWQLSKGSAMALLSSVK
ncbi:hypothetical protein FZI85_00075 [Mycobacterium sp. CBMA293]|uniref:hypothetical protein n=1 Tax=unclassified Mycolicibacterium TaxID=2636767 RepID=UPI0013269607|nr:MULTISPECIES: hypothetical protein [unclassified Mycolicibacterium]MUL49947.1 hypothetical protein [Mycolicibacterium sp. CBMA 360]MUL96799.1 hypothetical protein [Mycolicibacterium sp. CBMA 230]MUM34718.1 hypothetical protein [Mycolicibacterium sp. CBMA 361]MUL57702.1 hypothetical protein [Mycolicibacterium sp. CBMA 335]MUL72849.1 hypothetical protein [Mycolicibacterium sp. CBMA 311]